MLLSKRYPSISDYLAKGVTPLCDKLNCRPEELIGKRSFFPGNEIPWRSRNFETSDRLFHFYIPRQDQDFLPVRTVDTRYPIHLISVHSRHSMHSQHFSDRPESELPTVSISSATFGDFVASAGDTIKVVSENGELVCRLAIEESLPQNVAKVTQGWWHKNGSVNQLTSQHLSDNGEQATYNDCFCRLEKMQT